MTKQGFVITATLAVLLALCGLERSQTVAAGSPKPGLGPRKPEPGKTKETHELPLEDLYALALKYNPTIRAAESKVREAQDALDRTRSEILTLIAKAHYELASARELDDEAKERLHIEMSLGKVSSQRELSDVRLTRVRTKLELAKAEGLLISLVGKPVASPEKSDIVRVDPLGQPKTVAPAAPAPLPEVVRKALDTPVGVDLNDLTGPVVIEYLREMIVKGVNLHVSAKLKDSKVTLRLKEKVPVGAVLQWIEDQFGVKCVLRDYGIVIADRDVVPPGATMLLDAWRKPAAK